MKVRTLVFVEMNFLLFLCPALLAAGVLTLTIDSELGTSIEDCFERISIGEQLPPSAIYRDVSELTTRECEQICKQDKQCQTYDYGVGAKGNATCNLSKYGDKEIRDTKFGRNPDYDIYIRRVQCEQSPPIQLQPQFDEPINEPIPGSIHRPVFRPYDEEPKRPEDQNFLPGDFSRPGDIRPSFYRPKPHHYYDAPMRPVYGNRPENNHIDDRPDDYGNQKPENDQHLGYGQHQPQDTGFQQKPQRPFSDQVYGNGRPKPDPYDVLQFQDPYVRPRPPIYRPDYWRPDPYFPPSPDDEIQDIYGQKPNRPDRPIRPNDYPDRPVRPISPPHRPLRPIDDRPNYHYITKPNKPYQPQLPRPQENFGYAPSKPIYDYESNKPGFGQNDEGHQEGPIGPSSPYKPEIDDHRHKPNKPSHSTGQYASNYGQSSHYDQGNNIIVEIHDPPKPYRPSKRPMSEPGYGSQEFHDQHNEFGYGSQSHQTQSENQYHGSSQSSGYGQSHYGTLNSHGQNNYYRPQQDPMDHRPLRPSYGVQGSNYGSLSSIYGSQSYGSQSSSQHFDQYGGQNQYGSQNKPHDHYYQPQNQGNYGDSQNTGYGGQSTGYGSQTNSDQGLYTSHSSTSQSYGTTQSTYGTTSQNGPQNQYGNEDRPDQEYNNGPSSDIEDTGYKNNKPFKKPDDTTKKPNGNHKPANSHQRPDIGTHRPENGNQRPTIGTHRLDIGILRPEFGNHRPNQSAYMPDIKPVYEHDLDRPNEVPSYLVRPNGEVVTSRPVAVSDYGNRRPGISRDPGHEVPYKANQVSLFRKLRRLAVSADCMYSVY